MAKRHENELLLHLEKVEDLGCTLVRKQALLRWYDKDRVVGSVWRDIEEKWQEVIGEDEDMDEYPLLVGDAEGYWVFVHGEGMQTPVPASDPNKSAWLQDVRDLPKRRVS